MLVHDIHCDNASNPAWTITSGDARAALEQKGVVFNAPTSDTGVCRMVLFSDPDGNDLMLHNRCKPYEKQG